MKRRHILNFMKYLLQILARIFGKIFSIESGPMLMYLRLISEKFTTPYPKISDASDEFEHVDIACLEEKK